MLFNAIVAGDVSLTSCNVMTLRARQNLFSTGQFSTHNFAASKFKMVRLTDYVVLSSRYLTASLACSDKYI